MYLEKRTVEVYSSNLTIGPQEPRRPRFPFFHLHNVKERTSGASFEGDVSGSRASKISGTRRRFRLPGSTSALSVIVEQWEQQVLGVVNVAGCIRDVFVCQHPIFNFRKVRTLKPEIANL